MEFNLYKASGYYNVTDVNIEGDFMSIAHSYESCGSDTDNEMSNIPVADVIALFGVKDIETLKNWMIENYGKDSFAFDKLQKVFDQNGITYEYHFH